MASMRVTLHPKVLRVQRFRRGRVSGNDSLRNKRAGEKIEDAWAGEREEEAHEVPLDLPKRPKRPEDGSRSEEEIEHLKNMHEVTFRMLQSMGQAGNETCSRERKHERECNRQILEETHVSARVLALTSNTNC